MIDAVGAKVDSWKVGEKYDLLEEMANATYEVITVILFGRNVNKEIGNLEYIDYNSGNSQSLPFNEFYTKTSQDVMGTRFLLRNIFFPFIGEYNLAKPFTIHHKNIMTMWNALKQYLKKSKDEDSLYNRLIKSEEINEDEVSIKN